MDTDKGDLKHVAIPDFLTAESELDPDELRSFIISLVDQNAELGRKLEELNSVIKLSENTLIEVRKQAERIAGEIVKEANNKASAIISEAQKKGKLEADRIEAEAKQKKEDARQKGINAAAEKGQVILQSAIDKAEIIKAQAEVEAKRIIDEAKKEAEYSQKKARTLVEDETPNILREQNGGAAQAALPRKQKEKRQEYHSKPRRGEKGTVRYCWNVEIERQQHKIEVLLNTALGLFATGGGRLLVDGETINDWGCNPFSLIPGGRLDVEVANRRAFISPKGTTTKYPVLILGNQEIPPILIKS
jgi:vacuolar-type H+-ATPase subunit H